MNNTVISEEVLLRGILSKAKKITNDETKMNRPQGAIVNNISKQRNVVNLPGSVIVPDALYYTSAPTPMDNPFNKVQDEAVTLFPETTYAKNVITNDYNSPLIFDVDFAMQEVNRLQTLDRMKQMNQRANFTYKDELDQMILLD